MRRMNPTGASLLSLLLVPFVALASVGTVSRLEGTASRTPKGGTPVPLEVGAAVELNDTLSVGPRSNLKLLLTDESVVMLGADSQLRLDEATFEGQDRKGFRAYLSVGKFWAGVKKALAGSDAKFEVTTDRAVAGVRGTIFRVDAVSAMKASTLPKEKARARSPSTTVMVEDGKVAVEAQVRRPPISGTVQAPPKGGTAQPTRRVQVSGPQEVSADEWERRFVELQKGQQVKVGLSDWSPGPLDAKAMDDAFGRFVKENRPADH
jgi:hypothetical protein